MKKELKLSAFAGILSLWNLLVFNIPMLSYASKNVDPGFSGVAIVVSLTLLVFVLNYFAAYLILRLLKTPGKVIIALANFISAACVYFIIFFNNLMDKTMVANFFNTRYSEASGFINLKLIAWVLAFGLIPSILIVRQKIEYGSWKRFGAFCGISLGTGLVVILLNLNAVLWVGEHDTELGGLTMPWSYTVNTFRHFNSVRNTKREEILLPDATFADSTKTVTVLMIGESARKANFSLYGYQRNTNPLLSMREDITLLNARSCATYTTAGVKAILEYKDSPDLYEILPNYLFRAGADVIWRSGNWGEPPVHIDEYEDEDDLRKKYDCEDEDYDGILIEGLKERILQSKCNKVLIVLHMGTSHGPDYSTRYPDRFCTFTPVSDSVEEAARDRTALVNGYDNTIIYTDFLINSTIEQLRTLDGWDSSIIFVSDHGESLGEGKMFMHGVPLKIAPPEQYEIPFIVWTSDGKTVRAFSEEIDQHYVFHSVLRLLGVQSPVYDKEKDIFE